MIDMTINCYRVGNNEVKILPCKRHAVEIESFILNATLKAEQLRARDAGKRLLFFFVVFELLSFQIKVRHFLVVT